ncbi:hypothetical protein HDF10_003221 [Edaphobacter lichenicola]|uniref:Uncharacterized protein n=1 Tax=Tunturiibacter lichenicola TaxID=2051959 RepID=A0A7W8N6P9_9BACT|nr:hypothetical protein [Edaphobacter lichenicola]
MYETVAVLAHVAVYLVHGGKLRTLSLRDIEDVGITESNQNGFVLVGRVFLGFLLCLAANADDGSKNANTLLSLPHFAAKLVPCVQTRNARCVRPLSCDFEDIAKAVIVKAAHGVEVRRKRVAVT